MNSHIEVGMVVNIKRSDGLVHRATVMIVSYPFRMAILGWNQGVERKGRSVAFNDIWRWNAFQGRQEYDSSEQVAQNSPRTEPHHEQQLFPSLSLTVIETPSTSNESHDYEIKCVDASRQTYDSNPHPDTSQEKITTPTESETVERFSATSSNAARSQEMPTSQPRVEEGSSTRRSNSTTKTSPTSVPEKKNRQAMTVVDNMKKMEDDRYQLRLLHADIRADQERRQSLNKHWELDQLIESFRSNLHIQPSTIEDNKESQILVCVRKRPLSKQELERQEIDVLTVPNNELIIAHQLKQKVDTTKYILDKWFRFDHVFDVNCLNKSVYMHTAKPLVMKMFNGGTGTCFAFGQTGSGKTHTMGGSAKCADTGIYACVAADVFDLINITKYKSLEVTVVGSYYEIYSSKIFDLIEKRAPLTILEGKKGEVKIRGLSEKNVYSADEVMKLIRRGNRARTSAKTFANDSSSRSHSIFQLKLMRQGSSQPYGKLSLIDLAGNERGKGNKCMDDKMRKETANINLVLLRLKECIRAMATPGMHIPFRGSKLTQVLRDSFLGADKKICMIATVSPALGSCEHSIDTLNYADRVKELRIKDIKTLSKDDSTCSLKSSTGREM